MIISLFSQRFNTSANKEKAARHHSGTSCWRSSLLSTGRYSAYWSMLTGFDIYD